MEWLGLLLVPAIPDEGFCPTCKQTALLTRRGKCVWCDTVVATPRATRTKAGHNVNRGFPINMGEDVIEEAIARYRAGASVRQVGIELVDRTTYSSAKSLTMALYTQFRHRGIGILSRVEQNTKHGLSRREQRDPVYRREARIRRGEIRGVMCIEPHAGYHKRPCKRPALAGSGYCMFHDPARRDEVAATLTRARKARAAT